VSKNRTDLIHRALRNLGVLPQGQSPSAEESQSVSDIIDETLASIQAREVCLVEIDADEIEDEFFLPLGHIVAAVASSEFGQDNNQALWALKERAELDLKKMTAGRYTGKILQGEYF
jgi:hypothetical protein